MAEDEAQPRQFETSQAESRAKEASWARRDGSTCKASELIGASSAVAREGPRETSSVSEASRVPMPQPHQPNFAAEDELMMAPAPAHTQGANGAHSLDEPRGEEQHQNGKHHEGSEWARPAADLVGAMAGQPGVEEPPGATPRPHVSKGVSNGEHLSPEVEQAIVTLEGILERLSQLDAEGWFQQPVKESDAPNYFSIVKHPMCFQVSTCPGWAKGWAFCAPARESQPPWAVGTPSH